MEKIRRLLLTPGILGELGNSCTAEPHAPDPWGVYIISLLDQLLFNGKVGAVHFCWDATLMSNHGALGVTWRNAIGEVVITVDPTPPGESVGARAWSIIGTILHECCHAVFQKACIPGSPEHQNCILRIGATGHGFVWVRLALAVERRAAELLWPGPYLPPMGIEHSMMMDFVS